MCVCVCLRINVLTAPKTILLSVFFLKATSFVQTRALSLGDNNYMLVIKKKLDPNKREFTMQ